MRSRDAIHRSPSHSVLTAMERASYYCGFDAAQVEAQIADLVWAQAIVLIFPTWWFGPPAILKGWFDRVWAPGAAYDHAANLGAIRPRLEKLQKVVVATSLGSPWWADYFIFRRPVRRILKTAILRSCAPKATLTFLSFYKSERLAPKAVDQARARLRKALSAL